MRQFRALSGAALITLLVACGGGGDAGPPVGPAAPPSGPRLPPPASAPALKTTLAARYGVVNFPVGAAIEPASTTSADSRRAAQALQQHHGRKRHEAGHGVAQRAGHQRQHGAARRAAQLRARRHAGGLRPATTASSCAATRCSGTSRRPTGSSPATSATRSTTASTCSSGCATTSSPWFSTIPTSTPGTWSTKWPPTRRTPRTPYRTDSPWYLAYSVGGQDGSEYVRDAFTVRQPGAHLHRPHQRHDEADAERLQHRAARPSAPTCSPSCRTSSTPASRSTASATSSTCSSAPTSAR